MALLWGIVLTIDTLRPAGAAAVGQEAPAFDMPTLQEDQRITLESLKGKVVLLDFFTTWCKYCKQEFPVLVSLANRYQGQDVVIISVNSIEKERNGQLDIGKVRNLAQRFQLNYPVLIDYDDLTSDAYRVDAFPTLVLIDKEGKIRDFSQGYHSEEVLAEAISELLHP